jgi:hypothetical protein
MIKKILSYAIVITLATVPVFAKNYEEIFLQANAFYKKGDFKNAYELYKQIQNPSPQINYNMGNCSYKLGHFGYALLYWKRAEKNWGLFNREDLNHNLELLERQIFEQRHKNEDADQAKLYELKFQMFQLSSFFISIVYGMPLLALQLLFLLLWILLLFYKKYLYKKQKKFIIITLFILLAVSGTMIALKYSLSLCEKAVVTGKRTVVFSGPGETYQEIGVLPEASEIIVKKDTDAFCKIKHKGLVGWVESKTIEKI